MSEMFCVQLYTMYYFVNNYVEVVLDMIKILHT